MIKYSPGIQNPHDKFINFNEKIEKKNKTNTTELKYYIRGTNHRCLAQGCQADVWTPGSASDNYQKSPQQSG